MGEHSRETLTKPIFPADLSEPGFWTVFLPGPVASENKYPEWVQRLEPDFPDGLHQGGRVVNPELVLSLPSGYRLALQFYAPDVYYFLKGADLPHGGLLGHTDCHCQLPIFRWSEARQIAQILQEANPSLPEGAALLLLWPALWLNDSEFQEAKPVVLSILKALKLKPGDELTNPLRILHQGQAAPGELPDVEFEWWELQPGDWANNSLYSLRSITAFPGTKWEDPIRKKFNRVLEKLSVSGPDPTP